MLTRRMQIQALADRLAGLNPPIDPSQLTPPWIDCWRALDSAPGDEAHIALVSALRDLPERDWIIGAIVSARPGAALGPFHSLQDLASSLRPITWLWPGWVPRGMITLLGAVPGAGKSFLCLDLARRIIHGLAFPDGAPLHRAGASVVYVDAEAVPQLLNQRARQWQMDSSRLFLLLPQPGEMLDFGQARDQDRLVEMVSALSPDLVIIDSLSSISTKGENNVEDVRLVLGYLNLLAQEFDIGLVLIHHLRKGSSLQARLWDVSIDDFRGSGHIIAMSRSVMGLSVVQAQAEPDRNGPRKLEIIKTNLGAYPTPLGFEFAPLQPAGVFLKWGSAPQPYQEPTQLEKCKAWLESLLRFSAEPLKPRQVIEQGEEEGFGRSLIYRAREELSDSIQNTHGRQHPHNAWAWVDLGDPDNEEDP